MDIDGAIWVVSNPSSGGQVLKFIGGRRDSYYIRGLEQELGNNLKLVKTPELDRKSTRLNSSHIPLSRMPSSA